ncbi:YqeG family HAD IIIA-type phosphatase [Halarsenatibacter silvermanii]|uniref:YqeG family HAD IIIA-type phosphatase n=1 Tax=Halarsenatibacter silvermanii TaxID=321763 RepID=A0A1G9K0T6_9FIRM|nr:YqeG family HAD IIIA-type phosphatase [Halarsenatibacter silvermanii]SDL43302.1 hypothetical protein SAMN04488692_104141 [Halarsenatibacter silvermanii]
MLELLKPDDRFEHISDIDLDYFSDRNLFGMVIDIDNTVMPYSCQDIPGRIKTWINKADEMGYKISFVSNTATERTEYLAEEFGFPVYGMSLKPLRKNLLRVQNEFDIPKKNMVIIGDQIFTDILGGNLAGFYTILVEPLTERDFIVTKGLRWLESFIR